MKKLYSQPVVKVLGSVSKKTLGMSGSTTTDGSSSNYKSQHEITKIYDSDSAYWV